MDQAANTGIGFAKINGAMLRYRQSGDPSGPAVIFANSLGTDLTLWDPVQTLLPAGYRLIGLDKRGHGLSAVEPAAASIEDFADDVLALADHLGVDRFVLCGVSIGGLIGQATALRAPERLLGLVLCNTGLKIGTDAIWNERIAAAEGAGVASMADAVMARWFTPAFQESRPATLAGHRAMLVATPNAGYAAACRAIRDADYSAASARVRVPTLCIAGEQDLATPPELVKALADTIPGARYQAFSPCGHLPSVEQPAACAAAIADFLAEIDGAQIGAAPSQSYADGMRVRRQVLGDAHVDRASAAAGPLDQRFQRFITEGAWGSVWSGRQLPLRERSLLTLALLAAIGQDEELAMHLSATARTGASPADVAEALMHVAVYAGVPRANHALKIAKQVFDQQQHVAKGDMATSNTEG